MEDWQIVETKDANRIAILNEPVQRLHYERYPQYFKKYSYVEVLKHFEEQLKKENWFCYILSVSNKDVGYILFYLRDYKDNPFRKAYIGIQIDQICINQDYRHKGYANKLMEKVFEYSKIYKAIQIELTYWEDNIEAKKFYDKYGFKRVMNFVVRNTEY